MPFALVLIGLLLIVTGAKGTYAQFGTLVAGEFTGKPNFIEFAVAIIILGMLGYIDAFRTISRLLLFLVLIGIVVSNKGVFANFQKALAQGPTQPNALPQPASASIGPNSSQADVNSAIQGHESGVTNPLPGGSSNPPSSSGQAKFNGWLNYFLGK